MPDPSTPSRWRGLPGLAVVVAVAPVAVLMLQKLPQGFALSHERFWVTTALPVGFLVLGPLAIVGIARARLALVAASAAIVVALPMGVWLTFEALHPQSSEALPGWLPVALLFPALVLLPLRFERRAIAGGVITGFVIGAATTFAVRAPEPSTRPLDEAIPQAAPEPGEATLGPGASFSPTLGTLLVSSDVALRVEPLLTFESRSPDRSWTVFAADDVRFLPRRLVDAGHMGAAAVARYRTDGPETLFAEHRADHWRIDAFAALPEPVFAHLDTFTDLRFEANGSMAITLSPCGDEVIEVHHSDYPEGRPVRFGALYADGRFRVLEAATGEKGPFEELCDGPLAADDALILTFLVDGEPRASVTWLDFAAQASTEASPTGGWGVPQNALSLFREGEHESAPIFVRATLAATGVGRGWDSVGHRAGVYRNRMEVRLLPATP